jgi:hypothetical protein
MTGYANAASDPAGVNAEARSVNGRFLDLACACPTNCVAWSRPCATCSPAASSAARSNCGWPPAATGTLPGRNPTPDQLNRLAHLQNAVQGWLPQARDLSVNEVMQWCRSGATPGDDWTSRRWPPPGNASRACARRAPARATPGHHVAGPRGPPARTGRLRPPRCCPRWCNASRHDFWNAGPKPWPRAQAASGQSRTRLADRRSAPWARPRPLPSASTSPRNSPAWPPTWTRSNAAEGRRRTGQAAGVPDPGTAARGQHPGQQVAALELTNLSVEMKVAIEQMREQVQNIE